MTPGDIDRVFGRSRLRMVTGDHVEVFREETSPGERRRYTKRFLATTAGDFRHWTEREWRILARLVGHGIAPVPDVVQFDRGAADRPALVQTYDAGVTVDHWSTLLPIRREGVDHRHVFEDAAHWWALARHCLVALDAIHGLHLVHLDLKADNVCIPLGPVDFDPDDAAAVLWPRFEQMALIDFAFSLVEGERLTRALPIARQPDYAYQSPRLLHALEAGAAGDLGPTQRLDWRCDLYSLAAMLRRLLPDPERAPHACWTPERLGEARALVRRLIEAHDTDAGPVRPHDELIALAGRVLGEPDMAASLGRGWQLAARARRSGDDLATPVTRIAAPISEDLLRRAPAVEDRLLLAPRRERPPRRRVAPRLVAGVGALAAASVVAAGWWAWQAPWSSTERKIESAAAAATPPAAPSPVNATPAPAAPGASAVEEAVVSAEPAEQPVSFATASPSNGVLAPAPTPSPSQPPPPRPQVTAESGVADPVPPVRSKRQAPPPSKRQAVVVAAAAAPAAAAVPVAADKGAAAVARRPATRVATAPPRPATVPGTSQSERQRVLAWLTMRGPSPPSAVAAPGPAMPAPPAVALPTTTAPATAPVTVVPAVVVPPPPPPAAPPLPADFAARANELLASWLPRAARRAEPLVAHVLVVAAQADGAQRDDEIRIAVNALGVGREDGELDLTADAAEARRLAEGAAIAYWRRGQVREALGLQLKAFGANPLDSQVAGQFALLQLKDRPPQADTARQLALHALVRRDPRWQAPRADDWATLAIASALVGRERDARNAWFVAMALAPQPEIQCRAAINAYTRYGEPLRPAAEAVLNRAASAGLASRSPLCAWPPYWQSGNAGWR